MYSHRLATVFLILSFFCSPLAAEGTRLEIVQPEKVGLDSNHLRHIDDIVMDGIEKKLVPGCVLAFGRHGKLAFLKAYGNKQVEPETVPMTTDTVFDMASITKPVATATSVMILWERGKFRLKDRVSKFIPEFANNGKRNITILQLLTHQGGLIPDNALADYNDGAETAFQRIYDLKTYREPGTQFVYTDVGFLLLADLVKRITDQNVHEFSQENIFRPLGMTETGYLPSEALQQRSAVTEQREGRWMQGEVHDPRAYRLGGIAGHAGLFSTAEDLAVYAQMMLNGGKLNGKKILAKSTVDVMTRAYPVSSGTRGLGWDKLTGYSSNRGENLSARSFGHGGFTGTVLWIDPELDLFYVLLSNRVHPNGKGFVNHMAGQIGTVIAASILPEEQQVKKKRVSRVQPKKQLNAPKVKRRQQPTIVKTGIDVLQADDFRLLKGKRVGLITNQTGIDRHGESTIRLMQASTHVNLTALFSPEHGLEGKLDIANIDDATDESTGLKVFSLYGKTRRPTEEQLQHVDTLVFDIQDIGTRFYTYISTMGLAMQAAAEHGKEFIVLDRPNPIGGTKVAGPVLDEDKTSFVGFHPIPIQHGMTIGELAMMFKRELQLQLELQVVKVEGWRRQEQFDQTGLLWVNPSPNMRNLNQAILYPGIGLLETTNLSVGRGTDTPFEIVGAPWMDGRAVATALNAAGLPGVRFVPRQFTPESSVFANKTCSGINVLITDRNAFHAIRTGFEIASTLRRMYEKEWQVQKYNRLLGCSAVHEAIQQKRSWNKLKAVYSRDLSKFRKRRNEFLLYPRQSKKISRSTLHKHLDVR